MARPPIPESVKDQIKAIWAKDRGRPSKAVVQECRQQINECPSRAKVYGIIREAKQEVGDRSIPQDPPSVPWGPDWPKAPSAVAYLLRLQLGAALLPTVTTLDVRTAKWAVRLRDSLGPCETPQDVLRHLALAGEYGERARIAEFLGGQPYTADLDAYLTWRPWESEAQFKLYQQASESGLCAALPLPPEPGPGEDTMNPILALRFGPLFKESTLGSSGEERARLVVRFGPVVEALTKRTPAEGAGWKDVLELAIAVRSTLAKKGGKHAR